MIDTIKTILRSMFYSKSFILLIITFSIPLALSIALISVPFSISPPYYKGSIEGYASIKLLELKNSSVMIIGVKNESLLLKSLSISILSGKTGVLVSNTLNKTVNSTITLCLNGICNNYTINGIIVSEFNLPIIIVPFTFNSTNVTLTNGMNYALSSSVNSLLKLALLTSSIILISTIPAQIFSYKKMIKNIEDALVYLKIIGTSNKGILTSFLTSSLILSLLLSLYGISLGIVFYQIGLFLISHLNLPIPFALPGLNSVLFIFVISLISSIISSAISIGGSIDKIPI